MSEYDRILIHVRQDELRRHAYQLRAAREGRENARLERPAPRRRPAVRPGRIRADLRRLLKGGRRRGLA
jgi:hypothetical protein